MDIKLVDRSSIKKKNTLKHTLSVRIGLDVLFEISSIIDSAFVGIDRCNQMAISAMLSERAKARATFGGSCHINETRKVRGELR